MRNDEAEHMKTMQFCQLPGAILRSPSEAAACVVSADQTPSERCVDSYREHTDRTCEGLVDCLFNPGVGGGVEAPPAAGEEANDDDGNGGGGFAPVMNEI